MFRVIQQIPDEYITEEIDGYIIHRRIPGYVEIACDCGKTLACPDFTNTCDYCGRGYNWAGQLLASRSQWGEETGEIEADILGS